MNVILSGSCKPHELTTQHVWYDSDGVEHFFGLPVSYREMLTERIAANFKLHYGNLAMKLACMVVAMQPKMGDRPFALDRRGLSGSDREDGSPRSVSDMVKALGLSEWHARCAIDILRYIGFVEQDQQQAQDQNNTTWARWRRLRPFGRNRVANQQALRKAALQFKIGVDFLRARASEMKRRFLNVDRKAWLARQRRIQDAPINGLQSLDEIVSTLPDTQQGRKSQASRSAKSEISPKTAEIHTMGESISPSGMPRSFIGLNVLEMAHAAARTQIRDGGSMADHRAQTVHLERSYPQDIDDKLERALFNLASMVLGSQEPTQAPTVARKGGHD